MEFVLDYRDFQSTATVFRENCSQIWLQVGDNSAQEILYLFSEGFVKVVIPFFEWGDKWIMAGWFFPTCISPIRLLKISRIGSTITTSFNEGVGWVTLGTFSEVFTGDVIVQIAVYTGDNGTFHVSSDYITYEGQILSDVCQCPADNMPPTGCISGKVTKRRQGRRLQE